MGFWFLQFEAIINFGHFGCCQLEFFFPSVNIIFKNYGARGNYSRSFLALFDEFLDGLVGHILPKDNVAVGLCFQESCSSTDQAF